MNDTANANSHVEPGRGKKRKRERREIDFSKLHPSQNLTEEDVCLFLGICRASVRNKLDEGGPYHDPSFPKPHSMRGQADKGSAIRWKAGSVMDWNCNQPACSYGKSSR